MKTIHLIFAFVIGLFITVSVNAQSNENQLYYVNKVTVKPERIEQLLEISKTWLSAAKEYKYPYSVYVWQSNIYDFYWFYPVDDYNAVKDINAKNWELVPKLDEGFVKDFFENIEFMEDFFIRYVDSLTYNPETSVEGLVYGEWWIHYNKPWTDMKFRQAFRQAVKIRENTNFNYPTGTMQSDIGMNGGSAYISVFWGKDVTDLHANQAKGWEVLGEETQQLIGGLVPYRRKFKKIPFWYQKELSYTPE